MERLLKGLCIVLVLGGVGLIGYPMLGNLIAVRNQSTVIKKYESAAKKLRQEEKEDMLRKAGQYNQMLKGQEITDVFSGEESKVLPEEYFSILNINGNMGYLKIPKINVSLAIYHGTSQKVLEEGVGHVAETAVPVGGEGTHAVLTGHRGLPRAKLFTDLDLMTEGDHFYIHILDEVFAYEVDQIKVIEPAMTDSLKPIEGEDHVTLLTCTPYGINSHRLLVRGKRIPYDQAVPESETTVPWIDVMKAAALVMVLLIMILLIWKDRKTRRIKKRIEEIKREV